MEYKQASSKNRRNPRKKVGRYTGIRRKIPYLLLNGIMRLIYPMNAVVTGFRKVNEKFYKVYL